MFLIKKFPITNFPATGWIQIQQNTWIRIQWNERTFAASNLQASIPMEPQLTTYGMLEKDHPNHLRGIDHAEGAEVAIGEGEGGHDEDVGDVRLEEDWGEHPPLRQHVADQEQRDKADPVSTGEHTLV